MSQYYFSPKFDGVMGWWLRWWLVWFWVVGRLNNWWFTPPAPKLDGSRSKSRCRKGPILWVPPLQFLSHSHGGVTQGDGNLRHGKSEEALAIRWGPWDHVYIYTIIYIHTYVPYYIIIYIYVSHMYHMLYMYHIYYICITHINYIISHISV